jgi:hypothetical protein
VSVDVFLQLENCEETYRRTRIDIAMKGNASFKIYFPRKFMETAHSGENRSMLIF